jgi:hypothetical protein
MKALLETARSATPYLLIEVLLPGGTMIALILWAMRHRSELRAQGRRLIGRITGSSREPDGSVIATGSLAGNVASSA